MKLESDSERRSHARQVPHQNQKASSYSSHRKLGSPISDLRFFQHRHPLVSLLWALSVFQEELVAPCVLVAWSPWIPTTIAGGCRHKHQRIIEICNWRLARRKFRDLNVVGNLQVLVNWAPALKINGTLVSLQSKWNAFRTVKNLIDTATPAQALTPAGKLWRMEENRFQMAQGLPQSPCVANDHCQSLFLSHRNSCALAISQMCLEVPYGHSVTVTASNAFKLHPWTVSFLKTFTHVYCPGVGEAPQPQQEATPVASSNLNLVAGARRTPTCCLLEIARFAFLDRSQLQSRWKTAT